MYAIRSYYEWLTGLVASMLATLRDVLPIALVIFGFQLFVLRRPVPNLRRVLIGFIYVLLGLVLFLQGLEQALFPLGRLMAEQLTDPAFILVITSYSIHYTKLYDVLPWHYPRAGDAG